MSLHRLICVCLALLLMAGCDSSKRPPSTLGLVSLTTDLTQVAAGEPFNATITIENVRINAPEVHVIYVLSHRVRALQGTEDTEIETHQIADVVLTGVTEGITSHTSQLFVPGYVETDTYTLSAYIDPVNQIQERLEDDNHSEDIDTGDPNTYATLEITGSDYHDFVLDVVELNDGFALFEVPDASNSATLESDLIGHIDASHHSPGPGTATLTADVWINGAFVPLHLWNTSTSSYEFEQDIAFQYTEEGHFFGFDIQFDQVILNDLLAGFDPDADSNDMTLRFRLHDPSLTFEEFDDNNEMMLSVPYFFVQEEEDEIPAGARGQVRGNIANFDKSYSKTYGSKSKVAMTVNIDGSAEVNKGQLSADLAFGGGFDVSILDETETVLDAGLEAGADVSSASAGYNFAVNLLGSEVYSKGEEASVSDEFGYSWDESVNIVTTTFFIIVVPVTIEAGIEGSIGLSVGYGFEDFNFVVTNDLLNVAIDLFASAGVGVPGFSAGVEASFVVIENTLTNTITLVLNELISDSRFSINFRMDNTLEAIRGTFDAFVEYTTIKWCWKVVPCGTKKHHDTFPIYDTGAVFDKTWNLLNVNQSINF